MSVGEQINNISLLVYYKLLLERNRTGIDRRNVGLTFLFAREIEKRIEINEALRKQHDNLPKKLLYCI